VQDIEYTDRLLDLERTLPAILKREAEPKDAADRLEFAKFCFTYKKEYVAAVRFYFGAFQADAMLADSVHSNNYSQAARAAALAAAGRGNGSAELDDAARARLRQQALDWLRAQLRVWSDMLKIDAQTRRLQVQRALNECRSDIDLANLRDNLALANLPTAERQAWQQFWAEVDSLIKRVRGE
jgi:hypothetical protein